MAKFQDFAKVTEEIFEAETQYLTIIRSRAGSVDDYFQKASQEWKTMHETIVERSYSMNKWSGIDTMKMNVTIQRDLLEFRLRSPNSASSPSTKAGCWVKP